MTVVNFFTSSWIRVGFSLSLLMNASRVSASRPRTPTPENMEENDEDLQQIINRTWTEDSDEDVQDVHVVSNKLQSIHRFRKKFQTEK